MKSTATMKSTEQSLPAAAPAGSAPAKRRLYIGVGVFALSWALSLAAVPFVTGSDLSTSAKATLTGLLVLGGPKIGLLAAIAIMGKPGFAYLKSIIYGHLKTYAPPAEVSPARYRAGLIMLVSAIVFSVLEPYVSSFLPGYAEHHGVYSMSADLLMLASLFVLGGDFWDKLRALFIREAKVQFPAPAS